MDKGRGEGREERRKGEDGEALPQTEIYHYTTGKQSHAPIIDAAHF